MATSRGNGADRKLARKLELERYARLSPRERLEALASSPQGGQLIRTLPPHALYRDIAEVGLANSTDVVRLASPEQFRVFIDLAGWKRDRVDFREVVRWLRAARGTDDAEFLAKVHGLDTELVEFILRSSTFVHSLEENPDVPIQGPAIETPGGRYVVEFSVEGVELSAIRALLRDLVAEDPFGAERLLEALRWDIPSELEEGSYRFRMARLEELGFPPLEQAISIFSYIDPDTAKRQPRVDSGSRKELATVESDPWARATKGLDASEMQTLDEEIRYLVNCALVAEGAEPGDLEAIRRVAQMVRSTLGLGLEFLGARLGELAAKYIFQVGFSLGVRLKFRADRLARRPLAMVGGEYFVFPEQRALLVALRRKRPGRAAQDQANAAEPFQSLAEISEAEASLARAEQRVAIFTALLGPDLKAAQGQLARFGGPPATPEPELLFRAVVANAILFGELRLTPVPKEKLGELLERLFEREAELVRPRSAAQERAVSVLRRVVPESSIAELERSVQHSLQIFLAEWGEAFRKAMVPETRAVSVVLPLA